MGGFFKSKKESETTQEQSSKSTATPNLTPTATNLNALLEGYIKDRFAGPALPEGFEERGVGNISDAYGFANQNLVNNATARGMGGSPGLLAALQSSGADRAGSIGQFQSSIPMLEQQQRERDFLQAMGLFSAQPVGQTTTSEMSGSGTQKITDTPSPFSVVMGLGSLFAGAMGGGFGGGGGAAAGATGTPPVSFGQPQYTSIYQTPNFNFQNPGTAAWNPFGG